MWRLKPSWSQQDRPLGGTGMQRKRIRISWLAIGALTMALFLAPILIQSLRSSILDVLEADYIEVARSKGLSPRRIMFKHILRNAAIPVITVLAVNIGWLLSGAVIVETVFTIHGLGSQLVRSVGFRDYFTVQGLALVFSALVMVINLAADLAYFYRHSVKRPPQFSIVGGGTGTGVADAARGIVDIGLASRLLEPTDPPGLVLSPIARSGVCLATNRANPIPGLNRAQINANVAGLLTSWTQVPGSTRTDAIAPVRSRAVKASS